MGRQGKVVCVGVCLGGVTDWWKGVLHVMGGGGSCPISQYGFKLN